VSSGCLSLGGSTPASLRWSTFSGISYGNPVVSGDYVYGSATDELLKINKSTGEEYSDETDEGWFSYPEGNEISATIAATPTVADDRIFVNTQNKGLLCIDKDTGDVLWRYAPEGEADTQHETAYSDGKVYTASIGHGRGDVKIHAVDASDGSKVWTNNLGEVAKLSSVGVHSGALTYFTGFNDKVYALDGEGEVKWTAPAGGSVGIESLNVHGEALLFGTSSTQPISGVSGEKRRNGLTAVDKVTGERLWNHSDKDVHQVIGHGDKIYAGVFTDETASTDILNTQGKKIGSISVAGKMEFLNESLYIALDRLYSFSDTGERNWSDRFIEDDGGYLGIDSDERFLYLLHTRPTPELISVDPE
jgi:outer membrane protein assembly factor BamB